MELINTLAQAYAERFSSPEEPVLQQIAKETYEGHPHSQMLSGHLQGRFLEMISRLVSPLKILEVGTFVGYSAIYLSKGLKAGGELHTLELREQDAATAANNFKRAGVSEKIKLHVGNALEIIPALDHEWDLVFIDADKINYTAYYQSILPRVRKGGVILADNVLFHGEVLEEKVKTKNGKAIQAFNELVQQDQSVDKLMLTLRDGITFILKK